MAFLEALIDFDPSYGVPLGKFVGMRIRGRTLARYRKEWSYSTRQVSGGPPGGGEEAPSPVDPALGIDLRWGLSLLGALDRLILERLFWGGETEGNVARSLRVSKQWVSKRKAAAIARLRGLIDA